MESQTEADAWKKKYDIQLQDTYMKVMQHIKGGVTKATCVSFNFYCIIKVGFIHAACCFIDCFLRLLTECFILVGSAMFGTTFNLVTRVGLP